MHGSMHGALHGSIRGCINYFFVSKRIHYTLTGDNPHAACPSTPRWGGVCPATGGGGGGGWGGAFRTNFDLDPSSIDSMDLCMDPCIHPCIDPCKDPCIDPCMGPFMDPWILELGLPPPTRFPGALILFYFSANLSKIVKQKTIKNEFAPPPTRIDHRFRPPPKHHFESP